MAGIYTNTKRGIYLQVAEFVLYLLYYAPAFNSLKDTDKNLADCQQL